MEYNCFWTRENRILFLSSVSIRFLPHMVSHLQICNNSHNLFCIKFKVKVRTSGRVMGGVYVHMFFKHDTDKI